MCYREVCEYSDWHSDEDFNGNVITNLTFQETELISDLTEIYIDICTEPREIECRKVDTEEDFSSTGEEVHCDRTDGLTCTNNPNTTTHCSDYEIRVECCRQVEVPCTSPPSSRKFSYHTAVDHHVNRTCCRANVIIKQFKQYVELKERYDSVKYYFQPFPCTLFLCKNWQ